MNAQNNHAKHGVIILLAALAAVMLTVLAVNLAAAHEPDCLPEHRTATGNPASDCYHALEVLRDAPAPEVLVERVADVDYWASPDECGVYLSFQVDSHEAHFKEPLDYFGLDISIWQPGMTNNKIHWQPNWLNGHNWDDNSGGLETWIFRTPGYMKLPVGGWEHDGYVTYGLTSTLGGNPLKSWLSMREHGGQLYSGQAGSTGGEHRKKMVSWPIPDVSSLETEIVQCLLDLKQALETEEALKAAAEQQAAAELEAQREEARRIQVAEDQAAEIAAAAEVAAAEAEANVVKARALTEKLEGEREILAAWHAVERIRQQGRIERQGIINEHLALIEEDAAAWELEMQELAVEVSRLQGLNAAIVQGLADRQSRIATEIAVQQELERQALDALQELTEPEPGTPEPGTPEATRPPGTPES